VLLTNGWDRRMRRRAAELFQLDYAEMDERHHLTFDTYEEGKLSLDEYLGRVVFYVKRPFSPDDFKKFMFAQSEPYAPMIDLIRGLKHRYGLKVVTVSNEGRELTVHRIQQFGLAEFVDVFVSSCFVHYRKPDADIWRIALDVAQASTAESLYIDDRAMFVDVAEGLGLRGLHHTDYEKTRAALAAVGLELDGEQGNGNGR
jgi:putative hydrolase of the HAD superfamily